MLGRWHEGLAEVNPVMRSMALVAFGKLPDSTHEEAAACFQRAIALNPNRLMTISSWGQSTRRWDEPRKPDASVGKACGGTGVTAVTNPILAAPNRTCYQSFALKPHLDRWGPEVHCLEYRESYPQLAE